MGCLTSNAGETSDTAKKTKPRVVFVVGGPGCGKGTQCKKIVQEFKYVSFSTGDLLRKYVSDGTSPDAKELADDMQAGRLISTDKLMKILRAAITTSKEPKILIDGFPRNQENLNFWKKEMKDIAEVRAALYFQVTDEEMAKRLAGRNEGRADDNEETIKKRIETFTNETKPIIEALETEGKLIKIDAMKTVDEIFEDVKKAFKEKNLCQ